MGKKSVKKIRKNRKRTRVIKRSTVESSQKELSQRIGLTNAGPTGKGVRELLIQRMLTTGTPLGGAAASTSNHSNLIDKAELMSANSKRLELELEDKKKTIAAETAKTKDVEKALRKTNAALKKAEAEVDKREKNEEALHEYNKKLAEYNAKLVGTAHEQEIEEVKDTFKQTEMRFIESQMKLASSKQQFAKAEVGRQNEIKEKEIAALEADNKAYVDLMATENYKNALAQRTELAKKDLTVRFSLEYNKQLYEKQQELINLKAMEASAPDEETKTKMLKAVQDKFNKVNAELMKAREDGFNDKLFVKQYEASEEAALQVGVETELEKNRNTAYKDIYKSLTAETKEGGKKIDGIGANRRKKIVDLEKMKRKNINLENKIAATKDLKDAQEEAVRQQEHINALNSKESMETMKQINNIKRETIITEHRTKQTKLIAEADAALKERNAEASLHERMILEGGSPGVALRSQYDALNIKVENYAKGMADKERIWTDMQSKDPKGEIWANFISAYPGYANITKETIPTFDIDMLRGIQSTFYTYMASGAVNITTTPMVIGDPVDDTDIDAEALEAASTTSDPNQPTGFLDAMKEYQKEHPPKQGNTNVTPSIHPNPVGRPKKS